MMGRLCFRKNAKINTQHVTWGASTWSPGPLAPLAHGMADGDELMEAEALLLAPWGQGGAGANDDDDDDDDGAFDDAARLVLRPAQRGFQRRSPAAAAYARQCRATQLAQAKHDMLQNLHDSLATRSLT